MTQFTAIALKLLAGIILAVFLLKNIGITFRSPKLDALEDFGIFMKDWCRVRKARTDIETVLGPCRNQIKWSFDRKGVRTNASTSFISRWALKPAGQFSRFFIQSASSEGSLKTTGGDWWRVLIRSPAASLRPAVFDLGNGVYEVVFLIVEAGTYHVDITLDYTLCDGFRDPPENWFKLGKRSCGSTSVQLRTHNFFLSGGGGGGGRGGGGDSLVMAAA
jgi:hypothetical protein